MLRYIVTRPIKVGQRTLQAGDEVPEAAGWRNLKAYIAGGYILAVPVPQGGPDMERMEQLEADVADLRTTVDQLTTQVAGNAPPDSAGEDTDTGTGEREDEAERLKDPLGELSNEAYDALTPAEKGKRTRQANEAKGA